MANSLDQDIWTLEDNLTWYKGNHTLTFGTHNEIYDFSNLFIQDLYGTYNFQTPDDFNRYYDDYMDDGQLDPTKSYMNYYRYGHANVDVTGDPRWQASFGAAQLGFYAQDKWDATRNFQLTYGLRVDIPIFFDKPAANVPLNEYAKSRGWNVRTDQKLSSAPLWSPRVGSAGISTATAAISFVVEPEYSPAASRSYGFQTTSRTPEFRCRSTI